MDTPHHDSRPRVGRAVRIVACVAVVWSAGLLVAALTLPVYASDSVTGSATVSSAGETTGQTVQVTHDSATLVQVNGRGSLVGPAVVLALSVVVALALLRRRAGRGALVLAAACTCLVGGYSVLGLLTIGVVVMPVTACLTCACALSLERTWPTLFASPAGPPYS